MEKEMKKGQVLGQVVMFVLAGIIFVLILIYGYRAIIGLTERGEQVELLDFKGRLESAIETTKRDYGSVDKVDLRLPKADKVCFVTDPELEYDVINLESENPFIYQSWATGTENVFLFPKQPTPILIKSLVVDNNQGWFCMDATARRISLRIEGTGKEARISEWQREQ